MKNLTDPELELATELASRNLTLRIVESVSLLLVNLLALVGNTILCIVIRRNARLRQNTMNLFVLSLACSDLFMALLCMPFSAGVFVQGRWMYGRLLCQLQGFAFFVLAFVSLETMALVAVNRYINISKPAVYRTIFSRKRSLRLVLFLWLLCVIYVTVFTVAQWPAFYFDPGKTICHIKLSADRAYKMAWNIITAVVFALLPVVTIFFCYWKVFLEVRRHNAVIIRSLREQSLSNAPLLEDIKVTKLILALITGFSCCWIPSFSISYAQLAYPRVSEQRLLQTFWVYLVFSSSAINSFIYGILNRTFRKEILNFVSCHKHQDIVTEANEMNSL